MTTYRREIDGLRAVAVIPVILFHAGSYRFNGGFVGVDVFFVISGYLITNIIINELSQERFSLVNFYERRVRRILPALFFVMLVSLPFAWLFLLPGDLPGFAQSVMAVPLFIANFHFMENNYFSIASELRPMLHTWSLAVEEQFYAVVPILLLVTWRYGLRVTASVVAALFAGSFIAMLILQPEYPEFTFFMLPTRAWELLVGSAIAMYFFKKDITKHGVWSAQLGSIAGLFLITYSVFAFSDGMPFPSANALIPTIGTALVIVFAAPSNLVGQLLGSKLFVTIGLGSYSAYLWHFPLFSLIRHRAIEDVETVTMVLFGLLIIPLSYLSWRFVETPFRNKKRFSRRVVFGMSGACAMALIGLGAVGAQSDGILGRPHVTKQLLEVERNLEPNVGLRGNCEPVLTRFSCKTGAQPTAMVWGDSQAASLVHGIVASHRDVQIVQATTNGCGPVFGVAAFKGRPDSTRVKECLEQGDAVQRYLEETASIQYVILAGTYRVFFESGYRLVDRDNAVVDITSHREATPHFVSTVQYLEQLGKKVIVFSSLPTSGENVARCRVKSVFFQVPESHCDIPEKAYRARFAGTFQMLAAVAADTNAEVIDLSSVMCSNGVCSTEKQGVLLYQDDNHLSKDGSAFVMREINFGRLISP